MKKLLALMLAMGVLATGPIRAQEDAVACDFKALDAVYNKKLGEYLDYIGSIDVWKSTDPVLQAKSDASALAFGNRELCRQSINAGPLLFGQKVKLLALPAKR